MELRQVAEQVLFATTLDEKLRCSEIITDDRPGAPLVAPAAPGRPPELRFKAQGSAQADFPGMHRLEHERERGRLLHFFANHELLATELMALVLLRFPDAPPAFRRGVLRTMQDEQEHTRLYLERMKECGIHFGDLPVSGYFWRSVSPMENPMDYVAALSLTFEQANLDFCRHFARGFEAAGDDATSRLLERIYRDEIGHVAYGLKWFRRWKNPQESDWEAFCRRLKFPLSPQRAKGISLNVEGRLAAGLDPAFIAELNVYSQSKGRTPSVYVFNPFAEGRIARGQSFTPVKHQTMLASDLENLPQFLCRQDDIVLVEERPSVEFLSGIKQAGFALPEFVEVKGMQTDVSCPLTPTLSGSQGTISAASLIASLSPRGTSGERAGERGELRERKEPPLPNPLLPSGREGVGSKESVAHLGTSIAAPAEGEKRNAPIRGSRQIRSIPPGILRLAQRKIGSLRPWAWGPDAVELLGPFFANVTGENKRTREQHFNENIAQLYSKAWSAAFLNRVLQSSAKLTEDNGPGLSPPEPGRAALPRSSEITAAQPRRLTRVWADETWLCTEHEVGVAVDILEGALEAIASIRRRGHHKIGIKEALGLAGHNSIRLWEPELLETQRRWMAHALQGGRQLVIEPWLERELDFSVQLEMGTSGLKLCGYTGLINDRKGQFQANWAAANHVRRIPAKVAALLREPPDISDRLQRLYADVFHLLEAELQRAGYLGPVGIDAFVYRTPQGNCRFKPIVEINPRYTMGRLTVELMKRTCPGSHGLFRLVNCARARRDGFADFPSFARALREQFPLCFEGEPVPKIREGALCLNDPARARVCLAVFQVGRALNALMGNDSAD